MLLTESPNDKLDETIAFVEWKHRDEIANRGATKVTSILAAQVLMAKHLAAAGGSGVGAMTGDVWVYAHGVEVGLIAKLKDSESTSVIDPQRVQAFIEHHPLPSVQAKLKKAADKDSRLHLYGCNLGKRPETLSSLKLIFLDTASAACGPKLYFNITFNGRNLGGEIVKGCKASQVALKEAPTRRLVAEKIDEWTAQVEQAGCAKTKKLSTAQIRALVEKIVWKFYEDFLLEVHADLRAGWQAPSRLLAPTVSRADILEGMWEIFEQRGRVPYPYLSDWLRESAIAPPTSRDAAKAWRDRPGKTVVRPEESAWRKQWVASAGTGGGC
ncbi:MAG: hypothetical protein IT370_09050 [Deltaproteobacteria bacterium]|nr:hypothetical protein [Deltaproteobacteria bacterium]